MSLSVSGPSDAATSISAVREPSPCVQTWAGETVHLLPAPALWWPRGGVLFVADLHLGKAASYRALGQPVPGGTTGRNLARLDELVQSHAPSHMVFLGDFLHAAAARTPALLDALTRWREHHAALPMTLVRGNHDSHAGDPPSELGIAVVDEPHLLGPFAACHHPQTHATHFVLAGHLHPVCRLQGLGRDSLRLPCFVHDAATAEASGGSASPSQGLAVLPAFGEFTGGWLVPPSPGRRFHVVADGGVTALPPSRLGGASAMRRSAFRRGA